MSNEPSAKNAVCLKSYGMREKKGLSTGEPHCRARQADHVVVARRNERLPVVTLDVAVETADHPLEAAFVVGGEPQFLREHLDRRVVEQRRADSHLVGRGARAEDVVRHAARQLRGVAGHENVAIRVRTDRRQDRRAEVELHGQVAQREVVVEMLVELAILLALADVHPRLGRRERVGEDVERRPAGCSR